MEFPYTQQKQDGSHPRSTIVLTEEGTNALKGQFKDHYLRGARNDPEMPSYDHFDGQSLTALRVKVLDTGMIWARIRIDASYTIVEFVDILIPVAHVIAIYTRNVVNSTDAERHDELERKQHHENSRVLAEAFNHAGGTA